jgi:hypothetical protein
MLRRFEFALVSVTLLATSARGQEAIPRPGWIPNPDYVLVYPKHFGAEDVDNMLVELPNRPVRAGDKNAGGLVLQVPLRRPKAISGGVAGPDQILLTPFGPVSSDLQRAPRRAAKRSASMRQPLGW